MIIGAQSIIYSTDAEAEADHAFLRDVMGFPDVDAGGGWLMFGLPPAELAVHPSDTNNVHEFYLMCDDIDGFIGDMKVQQVDCSSITEEPWGRVVEITSPGGGDLDVYQPLHPRPPSVDTGA